MRSRRRGSLSVAASLALALLALCFAACGSDDQGASGSTANQGDTAAGTQEAKAAVDSERTTTTTTGKGPNGAEVFLNPNGSSIVPEFGVEASAAERQAAAEAVGEYIVGGSEERWSQQCRNLSRS